MLKFCVYRFNAGFGFYFSIQGQNEKISSLHYHYTILIYPSTSVHTNDLGVIPCRLPQTRSRTPGQDTLSRHPVTMHIDKVADASHLRSTTLPVYSPRVFLRNIPCTLSLVRLWCLSSGLCSRGYHVTFSFSLLFFILICIFFIPSSEFTKLDNSALVHCLSPITLSSLHCLASFPLFPPRPFVFCFSSAVLGYTDLR